MTRKGLKFLKSGYAVKTEKPIDEITEGLGAIAKKAEWFVKLDPVYTETEEYRKKLWETISTSASTVGLSIGSTLKPSEAVTGTYTGLLMAEGAEGLVQKFDDIVDEDDLKSIIVLLLEKLGGPVWFSDAEMEDADIRRLHATEDSVGLSVEVLPDYLVFDDEEPEPAEEEIVAVPSGSTWPVTWTVGSPVYEPTGTTPSTTTSTTTTGIKVTGTFKKTGEWTFDTYEPKDGPK